MEPLEKINQETRKAYNKAAVKYYELFYDELEKKEYDREFLDTFLKNFDPDSLICDLGCGPCGHIENYVLQKKINIIGIDISESCIEIAKNQYPEIHFEIGDFTNLNYSDNYFDGLISYYSVIDTPKIYMNKILGEFYRVLKKDGYLLMVVKEGKGEGYLDDLIGIKTQIYFSLFTEEEIKSFLEENGFDIIKLGKREPYNHEIKVNRLFLIGKKR